MLLPPRVFSLLRPGRWDAFRLHLCSLGPSKGLQCKPACGRHVCNQAEDCEKNGDSYKQDEDHFPHRPALIRQNRRRHLLGNRQHGDIVAAPYEPPLGILDAAP